MKGQETILPQLRNIAIFCMLGCVVVGCSYANKWCGVKDDKPIEELETGLHVNLIPLPENMA